MRCRRARGCAAARAGVFEARRIAMKKLFLSHACEVSCRIRAGDMALPRLRGFTPSRCARGPRPQIRRTADRRKVGSSAPAPWVLGHMDGGQDSACSSTESASANGIDRRQAVRQNSTFGHRDPYHADTRSLIHYAAWTIRALPYTPGAAACAVRGRRDAPCWRRHRLHRVRESPESGRRGALQPVPSGPARPSVYA